MVIPIRKKAEITSSQIVAIILVILGFAIILFVYYQLSWTGMVDREVCHQSVIYRGTSQYLTGTTSYVPLNCKTDKVCITSGILGGSCKEFENVKGVAKLKVKNKEEIEQFIAKDIIDCWQTMGEGKISIFSNFLADKYGLGTVYPSCVICTRIAFDNESLAKAKINLEDVNVVRYMMTHALPDKNVSYYNYLSGEKAKFSVNRQLDLKEIVIDPQSGKVAEGGSISFETGSISEQNNNTNAELSVLFMQISAPSHTGVLKNTLQTIGIGYGASFLLSPVVVTKATVGALTSPWAWAIAIIGGAYQQYSVASNRAISAGYCGDVSVGTDARDGCSVVRTTNYDVNEISKYCSVIESIP